MIQVLPDPWRSGGSNGCWGGEEHRRRQQRNWSQEERCTPPLQSTSDVPPNYLLLIFALFMQALRRLQARMWRKRKECSWWRGLRTRTSPTPATRKRRRKGRLKLWLLSIEFCSRIFTKLPDVFWKNFCVLKIKLNKKYNQWNHIVSVDFRTLGNYACPTSCYLSGSHLLLWWACISSGGAP